MTIYHIHHIIPKHMGGTDDSSNLIKLTVEEHAQAHLKLYEEHGRKEDYVAYMALSSQLGKEEILLEKARLGGFAKAAKEYPAWNKGIPTPRSKESIEKQKATITGVKRGPYKKKPPTLIFRGKKYSSISKAREDTGASYYTIKRHLQIL